MYVYILIICYNSLCQRNSNSILFVDRCAGSRAIRGDVCCLRAPKRRALRNIYIYINKNTYIYIYIYIHIHIHIHVNNDKTRRCPGASRPAPACRHTPPSAVPGYLVKIRAIDQVPGSKYVIRSASSQIWSQSRFAEMKLFEPRRVIICLSWARLFFTSKVSPFGDGLTK